MLDDAWIRNMAESLEKRRAGDASMYMWRLDRKQWHSEQRLYQGIGGKDLQPHQSRRVEEASCRLTVICTHGEPEVMGVGTLDLDPLGAADPQIDRALEIARANSNRPWKAIEPPSESYPQVATADPRILEDAAAVADELEAQARAGVKKLTGVRVNSAELFVNRTRGDVLTSSGMAYGCWRSDLYFEAAMEKDSGDDNEQEVHRFTSAVSTRDLNISNFLERAAEEARSMGLSREPDTARGVAAVLPAEYVAHLLDALRGHLSTTNEYNKMPHLLPGQEVWTQGQAPAGDRLTLRLDPFLDLMAESTIATGEGLVPRDGVVIENGKVTQQLISNRYGQYLGKKPNALCGNMVVPAGATGEAELRAEAGVIEVLSFSSLLVNSNSLTWSSEIKLGRLRKADGTTEWIKGGVMSGDLRENLLDCRFSRETDTFNFPGNMLHGSIGYQGPKAMLIRRGVAVAGA